MWQFKFLTIAYLCPILLLLFFSCNTGDKKKKETAKAISNSKQKIKITIDIQPFNDIEDEYVNYVFEHIKNVYPSVQLRKKISLPITAFYNPRNRYRADSLIKYLKKRTIKNHITIGLTSKDISTTKGIHQDWGVMGLGYCPGNACVVSTYRLSKIDLFEQLYKVSIHELGHTQGLHHCEIKYCIMRDAEGKNIINEEKDFCPKCKKYLSDKGWNL